LIGQLHIKEGKYKNQGAFMRVLKVKGVGNVSQSPDLIVILFKLISKDYDYDKAVNELNNRTVILRNDVVKAGFSKDDLKTTHFSIKTDYEYRNGQNVFLGYIAKHELKLEFDFNKNVLGNLLRIISASEADPEYQILFEVKDKRSFKDAVLNDAVYNAKQNASVIANAASIQLGKILNINYDYSEISYRSNVVLEEMMMATSQIDIVPEDVLGTDSVIIEWEIEDLLR